MIRIAPHLARVKRQRRPPESSGILDAGFHQQIWRRHLPPEFGFNQRRLKIRRQKFSTHSITRKCVPVCVLFQSSSCGKNGARPVFRERRGRLFLPPPSQCFGSSARVCGLIFSRPSGAVQFEFKTQPRRRRFFNSPQARLPPFLFAAAEA